MARERMVTRTVEVTVCDVMCLNIETAQPIVMTYEVGGGITEEKALLKILRKEYETKNHKLVAIQSVSMRETLYGMPESQFIELAKILPPRTIAK